MAKRPEGPIKRYSFAKVALRVIATGYITASIVVNFTTDPLLNPKPPYNMPPSKPTARAPTGAPVAKVPAASAQPTPGKAPRVPTTSTSVPSLNKPKTTPKSPTGKKATPKAK